MAVENSDIPVEIKALMDLFQGNITIRKKIGNFFMRNVHVMIIFLVIFFIVFGHIANTYGRDASEEILFIWRYFLLDPVNQGIPIVAISACCFILGFMDNFRPVAMKHGMWVGIMTVIASWVWHAFIHTDINVFVVYFSSYEGPLTLSSIIGLCILLTFAGNWLKQYIIKRKKEEISYLKRMKAESRI
ncbi:MAG: hypothetical protein GYA24_04355 [Candidatus Lokiarchaeota archaeon]|nr:hypothetical protein [Candidatus Lokiarchaeota archaeon]